MFFFFETSMYPPNICFQMQVFFQCTAWEILEFFEEVQRIQAGSAGKRGIPEGLAGSKAGGRWPGLASWSAPHLKLSE